MRYFQRVAWEAAALAVIDVEYGYGANAAGWLTPIAILGLTLLPAMTKHLHRRLGVDGFTALTEALELLGLLIMLRIGPATTASLVQFLVGSCIFYLGNWGQSVPYNSFRPDF